MYVVAGLPKSIHKEAVDTLQARLPLAIVKGIPSPSQDGALYSPALVNSLVRSVGEFAVRRRTRGNAQPTPGSITLLFVPAPDQERLLRRFDFALMSAPLPTLVARDGRYQQLRHDRDAAVAALVEAVRASGEARTNLNHVARRLGYRSDNEALLLPPRNFMTQDGDLVPAFLDLRQGNRLWTDRLEELGPTALTHDDVPARIQHQQTRRVFVDSRAVGFFIAHPAAYDGAAREVEDDEDVDQLLDTLRSLYRFGGALEPGLHHDAQRSDSSALGGAIFECCEKGRISANAPYANVYPNDFVRVANYTAVE
ncbi:hypothetical protein [Sphingosinicella xenopeptidilytica]|uniref:Uncharacterized protein n=1 Tax=Sphingosinicella xenopeptidilytica TaxID=364098 RepID=A0ABW3CA70_SPHXN